MFSSADVNFVFTARRYVSAVLWPCVCLSLCLSMSVSVTGRSFIETAERVPEEHSTKPFRNCVHVLCVKSTINF